MQEAPLHEDKPRQLTYTEQEVPLHGLSTKVELDATGRHPSCSRQLGGHVTRGVGDRHEEAPLMFDLMSGPNAPLMRAFQFCGWRGRAEGLTPETLKYLKT